MESFIDMVSALALALALALTLTLTLTLTLACVSVCSWVEVVRPGLLR